MTIFYVMLIATTEPHVLATLEGAEFTRAGISADLVERPAGLSDEQFAQQLVDAEGLQPWNDDQLSHAPRPGSLGSKAVFSADGREIIVRYASGPVHLSGMVCRFRLARGGMSTALWNAHRWCAAALGLTLPQAPPQAIGLAPQQH
jgi:hypothetical protein